MIVVLFPLILSPIRAASRSRLMVISCAFIFVVPRSAMSSAKSRSVSRFDVSHGIPKLSQSTAFFKRLSITIRKRKGDKMHPCLTPVYMAKKFVVPSSVLTQVEVEVCKDLNESLRDA
ncbi:hypothetical protein CHS0354_002162, partial [Potamilus streckersoni]